MTSKTATSDPVNNSQNNLWVMCCANRNCSAEGWRSSRQKSCQQIYFHVRGQSVAKLKVPKFTIWKISPDKIVEL